MSERLITSEPVSASADRNSTLWHVTVAGLNAMLATGGFVGVGILAGVAGWQMLAALLLGAIVTLCCRVSQRQVATLPEFSLPEDPLGEASLGEEIYGYSDGLLNPWLGFVAAWSFVWYQASLVAAVAVGLVGYALDVLGLNHPLTQVGGALLTIALITILRWSGIDPHFRGLPLRLPVILIVTLGSLLGFVGAGFHTLETSLTPFDLVSSLSLPLSLPLLFQTTSLVMVAYTSSMIGKPQELPAAQPLPKTVLLMVSGVLLLYGGVAIVALGLAGSTVLQDAVETLIPPLTVATRQILMPELLLLVAGGAVIALGNVLNHLLTTLSHSLWVMAIRRDLPEALVQFGGCKAIPALAGAISISLILVGDIKVLWSFSAFSVLVYLTVVNLAAYYYSWNHRWVAGLGAACCGLLIFWLDWQVWMTGLGMMIIGLIWRGINLWTIEQSEEEPEEESEQE